jgi:hypothetical protein
MGGGLLFSAVILLAAFPSAGALQFDGVDDVLDMGFFEADPSSFTIEAWIRKPVPMDGTADTIFSTDLTVFQVTPEGFLRFDWIDHIEAVDDRRVDTGRGWRHVAVVFDDESRIAFFVDGKPGDLHEPPGQLASLSLDRIRIGQDVLHHLDGDTSFRGDIDDVRFWGRARTEEEIRADMDRSLAGTESGLIACWNLDEGTGQRAYDACSEKFAWLGTVGEMADPQDPTWIDGDRGGRFIRGDVDEGGNVNLADVIRILLFLFVGRPDAVSCRDAADADDDGDLTLGDPVFLLSHLFLGGPAPREPFPEPGLDPTPDALTGCRL